MDKVPMTNNSYNLLEEELKTLKSEDRPNVIKAIAEAREHGDCLLYTSPSPRDRG